MRITIAAIGTVAFATILGLISPAEAQSIAKQCGSDWAAAKAAGTTNGQSWSQFYKTCKAQKAASVSATPTASPAAAAPAPSASPKASATPKPIPTHNAAAATGAGAYTTDAQAKAHCPSDTVVWVNTSSGVYHFAGTHNYGTTKRGTYMCEGDAKSAGDRAAENEKHP